MSAFLKERQSSSPSASLRAGRSLGALASKSEDGAAPRARAAQAVSVVLALGFIATLVAAILWFGVPAEPAAGKAPRIGGPYLP